MDLAPCFGLRSRCGIVFIICTIVLILYKNQFISPFPQLYTANSSCQPTVDFLPFITQSYPNDLPSALQAEKHNFPAFYPWRVQFSSAIGVFPLKHRWYGQDCVQRGKARRESVGTGSCSMGWTIGKAIGCCSGNCHASRSACLLDGRLLS